MQTSISSKNWLIFILLSIVWGSSFILIKKSLIAFSPIQVACLRIGISTIAFIPIVLSLRKWIPLSKIKYALLVGITGSGVPAFMYAIAETKLASAVTGILNSMTPIFTLLVGVFFFSMAWRRNQVIGILIGLIGALALVFVDPSTMSFSLNYYAFYVLIGAVCYGFSSNIVKKYCQDLHAVTLTGFSFFSVGWIALIWLFSTDFLQVMCEVPEAWFSLSAAALLAIIGTVVANIFFFKLIQNTDAVFGSSIAYFIPITAIIWGLADGEHIVVGHFIGLILIMIGVYVLQMRSK